jgi:hypothetical protein
MEVTHLVNPLVLGGFYMILLLVRPLIVVKIKQDILSL